MGKRVDSLHEMLEEIYAWFLANLQRPGADPITQSPSQAPHRKTESKPNLTFVVIAETPSSPKRTLLCPNAAFHPDWLDSRGCAGFSTLFSCHCPCPDNSSFGTLHERRLAYTRTISPPPLTKRMLKPTLTLLRSTTRQPHSASSRQSTALAAIRRFILVTRTRVTLSHRRHTFS